MKSYSKPSSRIPRFLPLACILSAFFAALVSGCAHTRVTAASNTRDYGDAIRTRFRYRLFCDDKDKDAFGRPYAYRIEMYRHCYPDVFDDEGIPIRLSLKDTLKKEGHDDIAVTGLISLFTLGIIPSVSKEHSHRICEFSSVGRRIGSVEVCAHRDVAMPIPPFVPSPITPLVFLGDGETCMSSNKKFVDHTYSVFTMSSEYCGLDDMAMAYGIASRLKELEDSGMIGERFATVARSSQSLSDATATRAKIQADAMARHGMASEVAGTDGSSPFEIVRCDNERGKDFAYVFALRRRGGGAATLSDYGVMRTAFRSSIRAHYASLHPDLNPRTLVIDFTEYALKGGVINGRVAVLTISPESLTYDSASRRGVVRVRIGEGQFEDARRWIRRNLVSLVNRRGIASGGDALPKGARFYSEREEMRGGVLEVSFKTE